MSTNNSRQALWIGIGSFFSFLVAIISPVILSRIFSKADYGTYKQVMFVYSSLVTVFTIGLPKAYSYFLPKYDNCYSKDIINKITHLFYLMGVVFSLFIFFCSDIISNLLNNEELSVALKIFSPTPFFLLPAFGLEGIYATYRKAQYLTIYTILTRILKVVLSVLPVFIFNGSYIHAIVGFDVASFLVFVSALWMKSYPVRSEKREKSVLTYRGILAFSLPLLYASIWGLIISSATQFFISRYYGNVVFADFSNGFMEIPFATMVVSAVAAVLLPRLSELEGSSSQQKNELIALWRSALIKSAKIIFPILIFSIVFSRIIMMCLYGDIYETSGVYFMIKNTSSLFYIVPFAPIMLAIGKTKAFATIHMVTTLLLVTLEFLCVKIVDSPIALAVISEVCQVFKLYLMMRVVALYANRPMIQLIPIKDLFKTLIACLMSALVTYGLMYLVSGNKYIMAMGFLLVYGFIYYIICWILKNSYKDIASGIIPSCLSNRIIRFVP